MALNKKQKKFISKNYKGMTVPDMARVAETTEEEVKNYLRKQGKIVEGDSRINPKEPVAGVVEIIKKNWKFLAILLLGIGLIYFNSLWGAFVSDDYATISQNSTVKNFGATVVGQQLALSSLLTWLMSNIFGNTNPIPFHVLSLVLYMIICVLAYVFLELLFGGKIAKISIVIFALMPIHVESVSWISGKPYLMNALFVLLCLIYTLLYFKTERKKYFWTVIGLLPLLFLADKVRSFSYVLLLGLMLVSFRNLSSIKVSWGKLLAVLTPLVVIGAVFMWPHIMARINSVNSGYNSSESVFYNPVFQYPTALTKYFQLALFPTDLTLYHTMYTFPVWFNRLVLLSYLALVIYFFFKDKRIFFGLAFICVAAAPSISPVKVSWLVAERYMFLGSLGLAMVLGILLDEVSRFSRWLPLSVLVLLGTYYSVAIYQRNVDWQTNHNLWVKTVQVSPNSHNAWNNIGDDYDKLGQYENAIKGFTMSTVVKPNYADAYHNRANIFYKIGRLDLARDSYETALSYSPTLYQTYISLIQIDLSERKPIEAMDHASKLVTLQPQNLQYRYIRAVVLSQLGEFDEAKKDITYVLSADPNNKSTKDLLMRIESFQNGQNPNNKPTK